jgi:hypothetical protein
MIGRKRGPLTLLEAEVAARVLTGHGGALFRGLDSRLWTLIEETGVIAPAEEGFGKTPYQMKQWTLP